MGCLQRWRPRRPPGVDAAAEFIIHQRSKRLLGTRTDASVPFLMADLAAGQAGNETVSHVCCFFGGALFFSTLQSHLYAVSEQPLFQSGLRSHHGGEERSEERTKGVKKGGENREDSVSKTELSFSNNRC